jgi:hypothetical protein
MPKHAIAGSQSCCEIINQRRTPITVEEFQKLMEWTYSDKGVALARAWEWMNEECFDGVLVPCPILLPSSPPFGHWVGLCTGNPQNETVHIQIKRDMTLGEQFNVLLHECLHAYLRELGQSTDHNAIPWCNEIMRLTRQIWGVEIHASPDSPRRINGVSKRVQKPSATGQQSITRTQISRWPHSIGLNVPTERFTDYTQLEVVFK